MAHWGEVARSKAVDWHRSFNETRYPTEIAEYWERLGKQEDMEKICDDIGREWWQ
jgi:hypothetical protein